MSIGELCNREVIVVNTDDSINTAVKLMRQHNVGDLVVVEQRGMTVIPVGILTDRDLVVEIMSKEVDPQSVTVGDIMSPELITAREDEELVDVVQRMRNNGVRRVPVVNTQGGLEGIIAVDDVLGLLAEQVSSLAELVRIEMQHERAARPH